jgi:transcriptional regulator with XRE-family HTH domain
VDNELGLLIKQLREEMGMTLTELNEKSGISIAQLSRIENGKRGTPKPETLQSLSKALKYPYTQLMVLAGYIKLEERDNEDKFKDYEEEAILRTELRAISRQLTDDEGRIFSYLQRELYEVVKNYEERLDIPEILTLLRKGFEEFPDDPEHVLSITGDTLDELFDYKFINNELVTKLSKPELKKLIDDLTLIAKKRNLYEPLKETFEAQVNPKDLMDMLRQPGLKFNGVQVSKEEQQRIIGYVEGMLNKD